MKNEILSIETAEKLAKYDKLQQRIDKAINLIKNTYFYSSRSNGKTLVNNYLNKLVKILEGEDNGA